MTHVARLPRLARLLIAASLALLATVSPAQPASTDPASTYPTRTIDWIVGWPPGGSVDQATRLVAHKLELALGRTVIVDNRSGASGSIALRLAARSAADGYTLITVPGPILSKVAAPQIGQELTGVAMLARGAIVLVGTHAHPMPADMASLIAAAKAHPDAFSFGSSGDGTGQHLAGELLNQIAGIHLTHIPYRGGSQAVADVISGQVPLAMLGISTVLQHIKSGRLIAYGVTSAARSPALPDVPTFAQAGVPQFEATQWFVVAAPKGVPAERIARLNAAIDQILKEPDVIADFDALGLAPAVSTPDQATRFVEDDLSRWRALAQKRGLSLD